MFYLTLCNCIPEGVTGSPCDLCPVLNVTFEKTQLTVWFNLLPSYGSSKTASGEGEVGGAQRGWAETRLRGYVEAKPFAPAPHLPETLE